MDSFRQYKLNDLNKYSNLFDILQSSCIFEKTGKGRSGANLSSIQSNELYPIIRTTTKYNLPNQPFKDIHCEIINLINSVTKKEMQFNNAMIEIYDDLYKDMQYHTDQSLDLCDNSYICIFSCYSSDELKSDRYLQIKNKLDNTLTDICLENNSIIVFDTNTNKKHLHKIYLKSSKHIINKNNKNKWLGITFRLSKTLIKFVNEIPYFSHNNKPLKLATEEESIQMRHMKYSENMLSNYVYPYDQIDYTISLGEFIKLVPNNHHRLD